MAAVRAASGGARTVRTLSPGVQFRPLSLAMATIFQTFQHLLLAYRTVQLYVPSC